MKYITFVCLCVVSVFADGTNDNLMPQGFEKIHLGMNWRSVIALRPKAEILNFFSDPGVDLKPNPDMPQEGLMEEPSDKMPYTVMYSFKDGLLVGVSFTTGGEKMAIPERHDLMKRMARNYGKPHKTYLMGETPEHGMAIWQDDVTEVRVFMPIISATAIDTFVGLQITNVEYAKSIKQFENVEKETEHGKEFEQWKAEVMKIISASTNAVKAIKTPPKEPSPVPAAP